MLVLYSGESQLQYGYISGANKEQEQYDYCSQEVPALPSGVASVESRDYLCRM